MENVKLTVVVKVKLAALKPHSRQFELFAPRSAAEDAALAKNLKDVGLDHPIEVLPNMTIVAGHRRVAAAKAIGWTEISAIVRQDLAEQGEDAITAFLIRDNAERRQLSALERARCAFELKKIGAVRRNQYGFDNDQWAIRQSTRDWIGKMLGVSGREASRLLNVLRTPTEVQSALDEGRLTLVLADRVSQLDREDQAEIAQAIRDGKDPKAVVEAARRPGQTPQRIRNAGLPRAAEGPRCNSGRAGGTHERSGSPRPADGWARPDPGTRRLPAARPDQPREGDEAAP